MSEPTQTNILYYGDNLDIPRQQAERIADKQAAEQKELFG